MYDHRAIEQKWQQRWAAEQPWAAREDHAKQKFYGLVEFPYPSGEGLHVGHLRSYTAMDVIARKRRMEGYEVLFPIGWDAFGLPAENYALKTGQHPRITTEQNCANFRRQLQAMGCSFDWSREVNTTDPQYYRWTQWIFLQLLKHGLAYKAKVPINWCPKDKIGLANEEAVGGVCDRCGGPVEKRDKEQWMLKITAYAEKLLAGLDTVDYIERAKVQQVNWIGRSEGAEITFALRGIPGQEDGKHNVTVFTTRPDTLFGATFLVVSPEFAKKWMDVGWQASDAVRSYVASALVGREQDRLNAEREKTGVDAGIRAVNPANGEEIPVWIADYVLGGYGTGAIMAVPAHDERDFAFAKQYGLEIRMVICPNYPKPTCPVLTEAYVGDGHLVDSGRFTGMAGAEAKRAITEAMGGKLAVTYKLRDWVFSRQRYWGEPIPIVFCPNCANDDGMQSAEWRMQNIGGVPCAVVPIPENQLPVLLPEVDKYQPTDTGESPLAAMADWVNTKCPQCGGAARRETDVMPNWAGSSWYFLRYCDPRNSTALASPEALTYWMPVDWYNGGMEHTTLHLLYSRFWYQFLYDIGAVPHHRVPERSEMTSAWAEGPRPTLREERASDPSGGKGVLRGTGRFPADREPYTKRTSHGMILASDGEKMSKSRGNVVNPDEIVAQFGADAVRLYEMFIGPFDQAVPWSTDGLVGCRRFLEKVATLAERVDAKPTDPKACIIPDTPIGRTLHKTMKKVTEDIEDMRFNTAVSAMMECANEFGKEERIPFMVYITFLTLLAPFAPHLTEEIHEHLPDPEAHAHRITDHPWPAFDPALVVDAEIDLVVQVNGRVRATLRVAASITEDAAQAAALANANVVKHLGGKTPAKIIVVPGKLVSVVV